MASPKNLQLAFGSVLRDARTRRGLSQEALALAAGLDRTYVSLLERGLRQPTLGSLFALCRILGVRPSLVVRRVEGLTAEK